MNLWEKVLKLQLTNNWYREVKTKLEDETMEVPKDVVYALEYHGFLWYNKPMYVLENEEVWSFMLSEAHKEAYMAHP